MSSFSWKSPSSRIFDCRYNRQFKYEEMDNYGVLHGRYGYYDQEGKLQVVTYTSDPEGGFHAEGEHVPKPNY